jgi:hypothetical protein
MRSVFICAYVVIAKRTSLCNCTTNFQIKYYIYLKYFNVLLREQKPIYRELSERRFITP